MKRKGDESNRTTNWLATSQAQWRVGPSSIMNNSESEMNNSEFKMKNSESEIFQAFQSINQSIEQSINQSNNQSINRTINQSNDQSINQSITHCWDNGLRAWTHAPSFGTQQWWRTEGVDACPSFGTVRYTKILHITNYYSWEMGACPWRQPWANEFKVQLYI